MNDMPYQGILACFLFSLAVCGYAEIGEESLVSRTGTPALWRNLNIMEKVYIRILFHYILKFRYNKYKLYDMYAFFAIIKFGCKKGTLRKKGETSFI